MLHSPIHKYKSVVEIVLVSHIIGDFDYPRYAILPRIIRILLFKNLKSILKCDYKEKLMKFFLTWRQFLCANLQFVCVLSLSSIKITTNKYYVILFVIISLLLRGVEMALKEIGYV